MARTIEANPGYAIFFDDVRVDKYISSWNCTIGIYAGMGSANFTMIYAPSFYQFDDEEGDNITSAGNDGIENMTVARIFVKNMFSGTYEQVFEGDIRAKTRTKVNGGYSLSFMATDYMNWLNRICVPLSIAITDKLEGTVDMLRWKTQGMDLKNDDSLTATNKVDITERNKTISEYINGIKEKTFSYNALFSDPNTAAMFDNAVNRISVMGDISQELTKASIFDYVISVESTAINSMYVAVNDLVQNFMFEFFQDKDGVIRVKPPFWNNGVPLNHVLDSSVVISLNENTNYDNLITRTVIEGNNEDYIADGTGGSQFFIPAIAYVGDLNDESKEFFEKSEGVV